MDAFDLYVKGWEHIWILWFISMIALTWGTARAFSGFNFSVLKKFHRCEEGAAYSFAYVLTFPFYVLFICIVVQTTIMLMTRTGVVYSAYCGARAATVYVPIIHTFKDSSDADEGREEAKKLAKKKIRQAVVAALAPFASSSKFHHEQMRVNIVTVGPEAWVNGDAYFEHYKKYIEDNNGADPIGNKGFFGYYRFGGGPVSKEYLVAKYRYAASPLVTGIDYPEQLEGNFKTGEPWTENVNVRVTYLAPFDIPVVGRFLGRIALPGSGNRFYVLPIQITIGLQAEAPKSTDGTLGIDDPFAP